MGLLEQWCSVVLRDDGFDFGNVDSGLLEDIPNPSVV